MEGTSEDPLVKDQSNDTPDIAKDGVIENGVNGLCENDYQQMEVIDDDDEDDDEHNKMETSDVADDISKEATNDNVEEAEEVAEGDEDDTEVVEAEEGLEQHDNDNDDDEEEVERLDDDDIEADDAPDNTSVAMTSQNDDDDNEKDDEEEEEEDGASDENNVLCAVTNDKDYDDEYEENPLQVDTGDDEMMEVDSHDNTSDIECLDDNVLQDRTNVKITKVSTDEINQSTPTATTTSNNNNDLNESIEIISSIDNNSDLKICEENGGDSGSGGSSIGSPDIEEIIDNKSNGHTPDEKSPKESKQKKSRKQIDLSNITPRRSSRNIKRTSYTEKEPEEVIDDNSDIEEIKPEDPLAVVDSKDKENTKLLLKSPIKINNNNNKTTIVVNDTKRLVEIAAGSKSSKGGGKKEPTLVIIDTNSILSGRGGIPVSSSSSSSNNSINNKSHSHSVSSTSSFSVMPVNLSGTTMYSNMRTTITPVPMTAKSIHQMTSKLGSSITAVPMTSSSSSSQLPITISSTSITPSSSSAHHQHQQRQFQQQQRHHEQQQRHHEQQQRHHDQQQRHHEQQQQQHEQQQQILPTLTDDMFVVEAPSFIVPYVYEKPPVIPLKEYVTKLDKCIEERERIDREKKREAKKAKKESGGGADGKKDDANNHHDDSSDSDDDDEDDDDVIVDNSSNNNNNVNKTNNDDNNSTTTNDNKSINDDKSSINDEKIDEKIKTYFDLPLGKFFMQIGVNLVQEFVQTDLLRTQKRKQSRGGGQASAETQIAINSLIKNLEFSKENNEPFRLEMKKCEFCNFKTESLLVMQNHLETPHMKNYLYKCNFCPLEVRSPHDIRFHMEAEHNTRSRLEKGPAFHQCPNCPFEDNQKGKLTRHILLCAKKYRPEKNLEPSSDWEPPAKIPRLNRARNSSGGPLNTNALAMAMSAKGQQPLLPKLLPAPSAGRGRGRPPMQPRFSDMKGLRPGGGGGGGSSRQDNSMPGMMYRPTSSGLLVPTSYQFGSNQLFSNTTVSSKSSPTAKLLSQPSISITPLPRTTSQTPVSGSGSSSKTGGKNTFVICEICDGYIKDLEQLRNHMQWIHKVKIHPKMIYNRPPLNCQKCQFRFFTDQGLERHLLGSHGLVTSSMQEAANKGKDAGRCPACGKVYQWKLLNHVARDHLMTLKPAHLSYKCTVCTATFGMYKQFENHVYSAHSAQSKQYKKNSSPASPSPRSSDSLLKPLKINDEITIIPQPAKPTTRSGGGSQGRNK
ncbi:hypothetical protein HCN44_000888 [Aphidius gifuensis]|uniref:MOG interacting and ectopic P-granules protein 1 n=1 Tax=Aphidius gifuensis TaxID=684658 RepID=A0A834XN92_APHGI|nr:probable WRKY transcription factor protein 1 [Aphidius gifuensis]XP_044014291.1 probable WRKY transcription factor protein 1 [Aphidius gifuensis]XP_044014292.1 probable WRKY transcription factor protein 1 [Aphidius gifuensis]XP_044014293.1 probable WRKY transcription factor protein 1 [Aphidius gifuensis]KAF7988315.1 hypothetical protein HCN44_000888 [Aphidius gifuensis]